MLTPKKSFSLGQRPAREKEEGGDRKPTGPIISLPGLPDPQKSPILVIQNTSPSSETGATALRPTPPPPQLLSSNWDDDTASDSGTTASTNSQWPRSPSQSNSSSPVLKHSIHHDDHDGDADDEDTGLVIASRIRQSAATPPELSDFPPFLSNFHDGDMQGEEDRSDDSIQDPTVHPLISITLPFPAPVSTSFSNSLSPSGINHCTPFPRIYHFRQRSVQLLITPINSPISGTPPSLSSPKLQISDAAGSPCRGDLSAIVEPETSALSILKHRPAVNEEDPADAQLYRRHESVDSAACPLPDGSGSHAQNRDSDRTLQPPGPDSPTTPVPELSTYQLAEIAAEVRNAMSAGSGQNGAWLRSVDEEASEPKIDLGPEQDGDIEEDLDHLGVRSGMGDVSFNVHALDPDLAAL